MAPGPRAAGVTLAELLVVVGVLALLVSIAVPVVGRARDRAEVTQCAASLHAVGRGLATYWNENDDRLPVGEMPFDVPQTELVTALGGKYVPGGEAFYCPSETRPELRFSQENYRAGRIGYFYYSCRQAAPFRSPTSKALRNFGGQTPNWPRALLASMPPGTWVMSDRWIAGEAAHPFGNHGMNYLVLDGSVTLVADSPVQVFK